MFSINSFDEAADRYWSIKPVISKNHTREDDVRPIDERRYWWNRIKRYDDNTYALLDGDYSEARTSPEYEFAMAPIVWTREVHGDHVRIRNGVDFAAHTSRYKFLEACVPRGITFRIRNGKQYLNVYTRDGWQEFVLPKTRYTFDHQNKKPRCDDDHVYLKFKAVGDGVYHSVHKIAASTTIIDKAMKKKWQPAIDAFYAYMAAIVPMLGLQWQDRMEYLTQFETWRKTHAAREPWGTHWGGIDVMGTPPHIARDIIANEGHELRVAFAALLAYEIGVARMRGLAVVSREDFARMRAAYNRVMNKILNMYETKEI
jgi:hypothetical protein